MSTSISGPTASIGRGGSASHAGRAGFIVLSIIAVALGLSSLSCSGGGGGSAAVAPTPSRVTDLRVTFPSDDEARIDLSLSVPDGREVELVAEYSEDLGRRFAEATLIDAPASVEPEDPSPARYSLRWRYKSDLSHIPQGDVVFRVTPRERATGRMGESDVSAVFEVGTSTAPRVLSVDVPATLAGARVPISIVVADDESDVATLDVRYRTAVDWVPASGADPDAAICETSPGGTAHTFVWDATGIGEGLVRNVQFRVAAADARAGEPCLSAPFDLNLIPPEIERLTVNGIPAEMNGSIPCLGTDGVEHAFRLALPPHGFTIDIDYTIQPGGSAIDPSTLRVSVDCPLGGGPIAGGLAAGSELAERFSAAAREAHWEVPESLSLPPGTHTLRASIGDLLGNRSAEAALTVDIATASAVLRPFDTVDRWYLDFRRDNFSISATPSGDDVIVDARYGANGTADFLEDLAVVGLRATSERADAAGASDRVTAWVQDEIATALGGHFGEIEEGGEITPQVGIRFSVASPYEAQSRIAIGGDDVVPGYTIGRAYYDYRNGARESNTAPDLGIFTTNLIQFYINSSYTFRLYFDALTPGRGIPVGEHPLDARVLAADFDRLGAENQADENARFDHVMTAAEGFARVVATILAHEIGHSVGLVANGRPSAGLFGAETAASFAGPYTNSFHLDTPGNNIMASAIGFGSAVATGIGRARFNEINWAYLQEKILLR
ncbi:MAG: hypothetical protein JXP34_11370 [Planctomycetes bacterium]|nr:hypothetical protein [Planctomycetota bacterium]